MQKRGVKTGRMGILPFGPVVDRRRRAPGRRCPGAAIRFCKNGGWDGHAAGDLMARALTRAATARDSKGDATVELAGGRRGRALLLGSRESGGGVRLGGMGCGWDA